MQRARIFFSPHPDDICIAAGAFAHAVAGPHSPTRMVLLTDGSEARMPPGVAGMTADGHRDPAQRGRLRLAEACEEGAILGMRSVSLAPAQDWFLRHATPPAAIDDDGSLRDVASFRPGPITAEAVDVLADMIAECAPCDVLMPWICDTLAMHRICVSLVLHAFVRPGMPAGIRLACYETLSTLDWPDFAPGVAPVLFGFGEDLMRTKREAIAAHASQHLRRATYGAYSSSDSRPYGERVAELNAHHARLHDCPAPYAERYVRIADPSVLLASMRPEWTIAC